MKRLRSLCRGMGSTFDLFGVGYAPAPPLGDLSDDVRAVVDDFETACRAVLAELDATPRPYGEPEEWP